MAPTPRELEPDYIRPAALDRREITPLFLKEHSIFRAYLKLGCGHLSPSYLLIELEGGEPGEPRGICCHPVEYEANSSGFWAKGGHHFSSRYSADVARIGDHITVFWVEGVSEWTYLSRPNTFNYQSSFDIIRREIVPSPARWFLHLADDDNPLGFDPMLLRDFRDISFLNMLNFGLQTASGVRPDQLAGLLAARGAARQVRV